MEDRFRQIIAERDTPSPGAAQRYLERIASAPSELSSEDHIRAYHSGALLLQLAFLRSDRMPEIVRHSALRVANLDSQIPANGINSLPNINHFIGTCSFAEDFHADALDENSHLYGKAVILRRDGLALGIMKLSGNQGVNPSVLALRTARAENGTYPLVTGGLYGTMSHVYRRALDAHATQGGFAALEIETLELKPLRLTEHFSSWSHRFVDSLPLMVRYLRSIRGDFDATAER